MEVGQCLRHVVADVDLEVEREGRGAVEEARETLVHELHDEHGQVALLVQVGTEKLDHVWVADAAQFFTLVVEALQDELALLVESMQAHREHGRLELLDGAREREVLAQRDNAVGTLAKHVAL